MKPRKKLNQKRERRGIRVRAKIAGNSEQPRLSVFRSNKFIYAQLVDDENGKTIVSASAKELGKAGDGKNKTEKSEMVGTMLAEKALKAGVKKAVFDRKMYAYHGRVKALAEGARKGGLKI